MKTTITTLFFSLAIGLLAFGSTVAGTLDPPGPPAPTMVTLQQIYDKLGAPAALPKTGDTGCFDTPGTPISCVGTGQDGAFAKGVSTSPRFTDNADGTVKDNLTELIWLKNANCFGGQIWADALTLSNTLASGACGLTDGSAAGAWRLPNVRELESLIDFGQSYPTLPSGHPFTGVQSFFYWTSTTYALFKPQAWSVNIGQSYNSVNNKSGNGFYVWPVRGGQ